MHIVVKFGGLLTPKLASCTLSPNPVMPPATGSANSTLTVSTGRRTPIGTYTLTITGASGSLNHSTKVGLTVN